MAILGHFWTFLDILWAAPGQNGEKIDFFENTKNVENCPQNLSKNSLERFRMVLGVKKCFSQYFTAKNHDFCHFPSLFAPLRPNFDLQAWKNE